MWQSASHWLTPRILIRRYWFILLYGLSCSTAECTKHSLAEVEIIFQRFSAKAGFYNHVIQWFSVILISKLFCDNLAHSFNSRYLYIAWLFTFSPKKNNDDRSPMAQHLSCADFITFIHISIMDIFDIESSKTIWQIQLVL